MTRTVFNELCAKHLIDPSIALENESLVEALQENDDEKVELILKTEF